MGEIDTNLPQLISETTGDATTFGFDDDDAPAIIVPNQTNPTTPAGPRPGPDDQSVRNLVGPGIENLGETSQICTDH
ncbi:MAG: hypothetical protein ABSG43_12545, partial [Solirubrobacteraceae bacterium]